MAGEDELTVGSGVPIRPPRLEDAGLEDCALPPESIAEAFSLAAAAVASRLARLPFTEDSDSDSEEARVSAPRGGGGCVEDPGPDRVGTAPDALVVGGGGVAGDGVDEVVVVGGGCGGGYEDAVVVGGRGEAEDAVVVVGERRGEKKELGKEDGCVEGVREGVSEPRRAQGDEDGEAAAEKAILVPDFD